MGTKLAGRRQRGEREEKRWVQQGECTMVSPKGEKRPGSVTLRFRRQPAKTAPRQPARGRFLSEYIFYALLGLLDCLDVVFCCYFILFVPGFVASHSGLTLSQVSLRMRKEPLATQQHKQRFPPPFFVSSFRLLLYREKRNMDCRKARWNAVAGAQELYWFLPDSGQ